MSKSLYEEAVADAQKLRELAEETAKNRVVDAVMPQIRQAGSWRMRTQIACHRRKGGIHSRGKGARLP